MRLINADALMEHVYRDRLNNRELIAEMVRNAPTVEPERKTGYWVCKIGYNVKLYMCSACNGWSSTNAYRYCPNCGARMED